MYVTRAGLILAAALVVFGPLQARSEDAVKSVSVTMTRLSLRGCSLDIERLGIITIEMGSCTKPWCMGRSLEQGLDS